MASPSPWSQVPESGRIPRVLIIAHAFPPSPVIGAQRPIGLYRHLRQFGWEPIVLTACAGEDLSGVIRIPHTRPGERLRELLRLPPNSGGFAGRFLRGVRKGLSGMTALPDDESGWMKPALAEALNLVHWNGGFNAILSTSPPVTAHLLAFRLKEHTGTPWLADLRDLWSDNYAYPWGEWRRSYDRRVERGALAGADALVTVSEPLAETLRTRYSNRVSVIPNGFPTDELATLGGPLTRTFSITYTGTIYQGKRDPTPLFAAIARLLHEPELREASFDIRFHGHNVEQTWLRAAIAEHGLERHVSVGGMLPRHEALALQRKSQLLLALDWLDESQPGVYTGKIFEYLAAQRPILSIGPPASVVDTLLTATRAGRQFQGGASLCEFLRQSYRAFENQGRVPYFGDLATIEGYSHMEMARQFARALDRVANRDALRRPLLGPRS